MPLIIQHVMVTQSIVLCYANRSLLYSRYYKTSMSVRNKETTVTRTMVCVPIHLEVSLVHVMLDFLEMVLAAMVNNESKLTTSVKCDLLLCRH